MLAGHNQAWGARNDHVGRWFRSNLCLTSAAVFVVLYCVVMARTNLVGLVQHRVEAPAAPRAAMRGPLVALPAEEVHERVVSDAALTGLIRGSRPDAALVSPSWIRNNRDIGQLLLVLDCNDAGTYQEGHLPQAVPFAAASTLLKDQTPKATGVVSIDKFKDIVKLLQVPKDATVIFYDDKKSLTAIRMWWVFRHYGFPVEQLKVLNGGLKHWIADGNEAVAGDPILPAPPVELWTDIKDMHLLVDLDTVKRALTEASTQFVDGRTPEEYAGENADGNARAGHIPGAVNFNWVDAIDASTGRFKSKDELKAIVVDTLRLDREKPVITYCQRAIRGAHVAFTLEQVLGFNDVKVYEDSMLQYLNREDTDVEKASE